MKRPATAPPLKDLPRSTRQDIEELAQIAKQLCDMAGAEPWTGYAVAGTLAQGLAQEWAEEQGESGGRE